MSDNLNKIKQLIQTLNHAADVYYNTGDEIMSNYEYDKLYDELVDLEIKTGIILPDSPTQKAGSEITPSLKKITHEYPALSLAKTKDITLFPKTFQVQDNKAVITWKEDGGTLVATYDNGILTTLATRGNGIIGQDVTHNAPFIKGLPAKIPIQSHFVVRGEALMSYEEFERVNNNLPDNAELYKNPRNLANATVSLTEEKQLEHREIWFHAFKLVHIEEPMANRTFFDDMELLKTYGFETTEHILCSTDELQEKMKTFSNQVNDYPFPVDGLVVAANDVLYAEKQQGTGKNPNKLVGFALKWEDETVETTLRQIEWSPSRTGLLNPVAIFDPIELEGTTVSRASVHNVSIVKKLQLHIGDTISVFKANKIIPQIAENLTPGKPLTYNESHPVLCPCCNTETNSMITENNNESVEIAICPNPDCPAKHVGRFTHFVERNCMNIMGLSKATVEQFVTNGWIKEFADIYHLDRYKDEIINTNGFGEKSYNNMIAAINTSRKTSFIPFIHALGIPNIGEGQAKLFAKEYNYDITAFLNDVYNQKDFSYINGIGPILNQNLIAWGQIHLTYMDTNNTDYDQEIKNLLAELEFEKPEQKTTTNSLSNLTFVITGDVHHFKNRNELKAKIEELGGKVSGSVSSKTNYLINNDVTSTSGKNKKAKELNIPIISEDEFLNMI